MSGSSGVAGWLSSCRQYVLREHRVHFFGTLLVLIVFFIFMMAFQVNLQWFWLLLYAALILPFAPYVTKPEFFFRSVDHMSDVASASNVHHCVAALV